jgi:hypothetical protein
MGIYGIVKLFGGDRYLQLVDGGWMSKKVHDYVWLALLCSVNGIQSARKGFF